MDEASSVKRPRDELDNEESSLKRQKPGDSTSSFAAADDDDFEALLAGAYEEEVQQPPEELARRSFCEGLMAKSGRIAEDELPSLLEILTSSAPTWGAIRHWRSASLLLACVARSSRGCRLAFVGAGLPMLGAVLQEAVAGLEAGGARERQEAGMWASAVLLCLKALPLTRAALWEHRKSIGKAFDRLHRWCGQEKTALAAELRAPTQALCRRWRQQPKPAGQASPAEKAVRAKVVDMIAKGLMGIAGTSPASPAPPVPASPGRIPNLTAASEIEAALFGRHGSASAEYRQHARMLRSNLALPSNAELRSRVLAGEMQAEELVALDSVHLAPDVLQEQRRAAELKVMRESVIEELVPIREEESSPRSRRNTSTAPQLLVRSPRPRDEKDQTELPRSAASNLLPPPTPLNEFSTHPGRDTQSPDVMATPAIEDEEEDEASLLRYLSSAPGES